MRFAIPALLLALALGGTGGCVTSGTVTPGDRQVEDQLRQAIEIMLETYQKAMAEVEQGSKAWTILGMGATAGQVALLNAQHLQAVHGPPEEPMPFSEVNSEKARAQSKKEHESGGLGGKVLGILGAAAGVAATLAGMPWISKLFPGLAGVVGRAAQTGPKVIAYAREAFEARGWNEQAKVLLKIADEENILSGVKSWVVKQANSLEEKLGLDFKVKLEEPTAPAAATSNTATQPTATSLTP